MTHTRAKDYEGTTKALRKFKRQIDKMTYEELANKSDIREMVNNICKEFKEDVFFNCIIFDEKATSYWLKKKSQRWLELVG